MSQGRGRISQEFLQKIKDQVSILEVVGEHVVLKKSGANHTGLCPFHSERSPSFSVNEQKKLYHCYGCKKGGDLFAFVMEIHGLSFPEAVEELAERARIPLPKDWSDPAGGAGGKDEDPEVARRRAQAREKLALASKLNRFVASFYHQQLQQQPEVLEYFQSRGVGPDLQRAFYLGAAPAAWDALSRHLTAKQAPLPLAVELGLIRPSQKKPGESFDLFRNRAMFPILDLRGKVAGFGGRLMPSAKEAGSDGPKYLNSSESLVFHKNKLAFGLYQAQKHVREEDEIIVVEGYFDVLALHAAGFENVVATCGTSLTPEHLSLFKRFCSKVTLLFDGDKAGIAATERAMELGLEQGWILHGATLPEGLDPDELLFDQVTGKPVPGGKERMQEILGQAQPLLDVRIADEVAKASQGPEARTQAIKRIGSWLGRLKDPVGRGVRLESVQKALAVGPGILEQALPAELRSRLQPGQGRPAGRPPSPPNSVRAPRPAGKSAPKAQRLSPREKTLLIALLRGGEFSGFFTQLRDKLPPERGLPDLFEFAPAHALVDQIFRQPGGWERFKAAPETYLDDPMDAQVRSIFTEALIASQSPVEESEVRAALEKSIGRLWARFSQQIKAALTEAEAKKDAGLQARLMKEYLDVQRRMKEFSSFYDEA